MTSYQWWSQSASGSFSDPNNWWVDPNLPPQGPPGPGDDAALICEPYTPTANGITVSGGSGTVSRLTFEGTVTLAGANITGISLVDIGSNSTNALLGFLTLTGGSTLAGPVGNTGTGVEMFATVEVEGASTITGYQVQSFETLLVESGLISATDFTAGGFASAFSGFIPGSVDIAAAGTISDTLGILGITTSDIASMSVEGGGKWLNQGLGIGSAGSVTMTISGGSTVSTGGGAAFPGGPALTVGGTGGTGTTLTVTGASSALTDGNDAWIGGSNTTAVSLESGGAITIDGSLDVGHFAGGTTSVQIGAGSTLTADGAVTLGGAGTATVSVEASGELAVGGALVVGGTGSASLDINAGALDITGQTITAGAGGGGNGDISVESASVADASGNIVIGNAGTGSLSVNTGGSISANDLDIGQGLTGNGTVVFSGGNGNFSDVNVGAAGAAAIEVTAKATLSTTNFTAATGKVAVPAGVTVDGKGVLNAALQLVVGAAGEATLEIQSGGTATAATVIVGEAHSGNGALLFDSAATSTSTLVYGSLFEIGALGTADVSLAGSASVSAGALAVGTVEIGLSSGATGTLAISGAHAALATTTLDIGGGTTAGGAGIVSLAAGGVIQAAAATIWHTGTLALSGGTLAGTSETAQGHITGFGTVVGSIDNTSTITATGGVLHLDGPAAGSGTLALDAGTLDLRQGAAGSSIIQFGTNGGQLQSEALGATAATIEGFTFGDSVLLAGALANAGTWAGGVLTLEEGTTTIGTLAVAGAYTANNFQVSNDGTSTTVEMACFATGTGITTVRGRVPVEGLCVGERVPTLSGRIAEVRWIGHRALDLRRHPHPENVMPVRVHAGAFGAGVPSRDLVLSPDHAVLVKGALIPVRHLVNGVNVAQETGAAIAYWHIELDRHDVLLAEGLACETYLDTGNRHAFEGQAALDLHPDFTQARSLAIWKARGCAAIATAAGDPRLRAAHTALLAAATLAAGSRATSIASVRTA